MGDHAATDADDQTADDTAGEHQRVDALEAQVDAVQGRLGDATEEAGRQGAGRGLTHVGVAVADRQEEHAGGGAEAGEVPRAHGALDEVRTRRGDVRQLQGVERPVQTQRHQEGVDDRDDDCEEDGGMAVEPGQAATQAVTDPDRQGADQEGSQRHDDHEGDEGDEHHLDVRRDDLLQSLVDQRQDRDHQQRHEDLAPVVGQLQGQVADQRNIVDLGRALQQVVAAFDELDAGGGGELVNVAQAQEVGGEQ